MLGLLILFIFFRLWLEGFVPNVFVVARAHSVSPSIIVSTVLARRSGVVRLEEK